MYLVDLSWNASLASSAAKAANEVHNAVKASHTASNAKRAAERAAKRASDVCETSTFSTIEDASQAQRQASDTRSQAIHAAVVEYEANTAKRQATVALARDVKCWNVHRKQELITSCLSFVQSRRNYAQESKEIWEGLRDSLLQSPSIKTIVNCKIETPKKVYGDPLKKQSFQEESDIPSTTLMNEMNDTEPLSASDACTELDVIREDGTLYDAINVNNTYLPSSPPGNESGFHDTFEDRIPTENDFNRSLNNNDDSNEHYVADVENETLESVQYSPKEEEGIDMTKSENVRIQSENISHLLSHVDERDLEVAFATANNDQSYGQGVPNQDETVSITHTVDQPKEETHTHCQLERSEENGFDIDVASADGLSGSMQSLVDGLMNWGDQWDHDEDHTPLPDGMAQSLLEENAILQ